MQVSFSDKTHYQVRYLLYVSVSFCSRWSCIGSRCDFGPPLRDPGMSWAWSGNIPKNYPFSYQIGVSTFCPFPREHQAPEVSMPLHKEGAGTFSTCCIWLGKKVSVKLDFQVREGAEKSTETRQRWKNARKLPFISAKIHTRCRVVFLSSFISALFLYFFQLLP